MKYNYDVVIMDGFTQLCRYTTNSKPVVGEHIHLPKEFTYKITSVQHILKEEDGQIILDYLVVDV